MGMMLPLSARLPLMGMWTFDVKSNIVFGDSVLALYFGVSEEDAARGVPLQTFLDAIHPDDLGRIRAEIAETYAGRSTFLSEYRVLGRDKKWRRILATGRCFYLDNEPVQYPGFVVEMDQIFDRPEGSLDELADFVMAARKVAAADKRDFIVYILNMVLQEVGRSLASHQVAQLMPQASSQR